MDLDYPVGVCSEMCPQEEIERREKHGLLHILEIIPDTKKSSTPKADQNRVVKEYRRSAAGQESQSVKELRTSSALLKTVYYLLHDVIVLEDVRYNIIYDFILDRLRAVRQDMVIQNFSKVVCIQLLEPMIKFYVYSAYRLCEEPLNLFDPYMNNTHLQESLKRLLCHYDEFDALHLKVTQRNDIKMANMFSESRPIMESLYLIINLGNIIAINRSLKLPVDWKTPLVQKCTKISIEFWKKNYIRVCREISTLPILLSMYAVLHLPVIRRDTLKIMSAAYNSRNTPFPGLVLQNMYLYNNMEELLKDCKHYGVNTFNNSIYFSIQTFHVKQSKMPCKRVKFVDEQLKNINVPDLLLTNVL